MQVSSVEVSILQHTRKQQMCMQRKTAKQCLYICNPTILGGRLHIEIFKKFQKNLVWKKVLLLYEDMAEKEELLHLLCHSQGNFRRIYKSMDMTLLLCNTEKIITKLWCLTAMLSNQQTL